MSWRRLLEVFRLDFGLHLRRPVLWVLVLMMGLMSWGLSSGDAQISSGDTSVGGQRAWITSQFSVAYILSLSVFAFYTFFVAVLAGLAVIRDDELRVGELLHVTSLRVGEYVWGKLLAVLAAFGGVLGLHLALMVLFNHLVPHSKAAEIRGPFVLANYLVPALLFSLPTLVLVTGVCFAVGERSRRPILVFVLPLALVVFSLFFFWNWSPSWLDPRLNRLLMLIDPGGFRWLDETWLKVDRGVAFYNGGRIGFDLPFLGSRLVLMLIGLGAVAWSHRRLAATLRGKVRVRPAKRREEEALRAAARTANETIRGRLSALGMSMRPPGLLRGTVAVARAELKELATSPGLYLFTPIIIIQSFGSLVNTGAIDAPLLVTSGLTAARLFNILTVLVCLLLAFYTVESLWRDRATRLAPLVSSSPLPSTALLLGKCLANSLVGAVILLAALLTCLAMVLMQGKVSFALGPFLVLWGCLLLPTFVLFTAFVAAAFALTRSRYASYAIAIGAFALTGYLQFRDKMSWVGNWDLWGVAGWSDMGPLELDRPALVLNRVLALSLAAALVALAVRLYPRTERDAVLALARLEPQQLARSLLRFSPLLLVPLVSGVALYALVDRGPEGGGGKKRAKDYWKQNLATFHDALLPDLDAVELDVTLEPERSSFAVRGSYRLINRRADPLPRFPVTTGLHFEDVAWTLDGQPYRPESRSGLWVIAPPAPLNPGQTLELGFSHHGRLPAGVSRNGGRQEEFILPAGVVLTSFTPSFVPVLGFLDEIGVEEENRFELKVYPEDFWIGVTEPMFGSASPFTTCITVTVPEAYVVNSVGMPVAEEVRDGRRTTEWRSDQPVRFFNLVVGRWEVRRGDGTAVFFHAQHPYNVDEMLAALDGSRRYYSEWFWPYPWQELKLSEFADNARYAQGFPTNITFSEGIGFLTRDDPRSNTAFAIAAHEAAHQWWGNILTPGKGPGGNVVAEGLAHFSTALLLEQVRGELYAMEFRKRIEATYGRSRRADAERPLVRVDGSKEGDTTVTYDKGGWVFWMLADLMGRDQALAGLRELIAAHKDGPDFPVLQDLIAALRPHAPDLVAFDAFVAQWFYQVVVPEYRIVEVSSSRIDAEDERYEVRILLRNEGSGTVPVEVAAARGDRLGDDGQPNPDYRDARATVTLGPGEEAAATVVCRFRPDRVLPDPDVRVLQLNRNRALRRL